MLARFSGSTRAEQQRFIGWAVLAAGLVGAAIVYIVAARAAEPAVDDATALGYARSMQHQMGAMMGHFGMMLTDWQTALGSPIGEALVVLACAALLAAYFFRVAWVLDQDERDRSAS